MDLLDFQDPKLYFETELPEEVAALLSVASKEYGSVEAREALENAQRIAPECLDVLVAVFRYHYYQHDLSKARDAGLSAASVVRKELGIADPLQMTQLDYESAFRAHPGPARFLLQTLKGIGYLSLRLADFEMGRAYLQKVVELDEQDRLGCQSLLELIESDPAWQEPSPSAPTSLENHSPRN